MVPVKIISMATTVRVYLGIQEEIVLSVSHIIYIYLRLLLLTFIAMALAVLIHLDT